MIRELRLRGLGVIDEAVVPFAPGLTVLTGETGAGKTMVLTGLGLIMGAKADAGVVRTGSPRADVEGMISLPADAGRALLDRLDEAGADLDVDGSGGVLLLARSVAAEGRSRAFAGGRGVPAATLAEVTEYLISVHGQSDQLLIREPRRQREVLDRFAGPDLAHEMVGYRSAFADWRDAQRLLRDLVDGRDERAREASMLRHGIDEISAVQPTAGEDARLKAQANVLAHASDLATDVGAVHDLLVGGDDSGGTESAVDLVLQARRILERSAVLDEGLAPLVARAASAGETLADLATELSAYARAIDSDPQLLEAVEERRRQITALMRRYGPGLDDVLDWWANAEAAVGQADGAGERITELTAQVAALRRKVVAAAAVVSGLRRRAAEAFAGAVTGELHDLAMPDSRLTVDIDTATEPEAFSADGADTVAMLLTPHGGSEPRPLGKGASGGELSRIMLAIEVVLAAVNTVPTFVFDEVDAGIGGKVAVEVGRRLARLARDSQVIVVTHLPQVAAFADHHLVVSKDRDGRVTSASVAVVEGSARVAELVRMLSGLEGSQSGADHVAELLALADAERG